MSLVLNDNLSVSETGVSLNTLPRKRNRGNGRYFKMGLLVGAFPHDNFFDKKRKKYLD